MAASAYGAVRQRGAMRGVKGAGLQRVKRQHAPGRPSMRSATPMQSCTGRFARASSGAVIGVGQGTVVVEAGDLAARQQEPPGRVLVHGKTPPQRLAYQTIDHHRAQVFFFQPQQPRRRSKVRAQTADQALQAHVGRQFGGQIGQPGGFKGYS